MKNAIESVHKIMDWWATKGYKTPDFNLIMDARGKLSGLYYFINDELSEAIKEAESSKFRRKMKIAELYEELASKKNEAGKRTFTVEQIKHKAESGAEKEIEDELSSYSYMIKLKFLSESVKEVLNSMAQKVAIGRDEFKKSQNAV